MPVTTVIISNLPTFDPVGIGYQFSGIVNLESVITAPIQINSMSLYFGFARVYVSAPYMTAVCGDTTFRTDFFHLSGDDQLRKRTLNILAWSVGNNHILSQNGRTITFTLQRNDSTTANLIDRPRYGDMTLEIDYTILFQASTFTLSSSSVTMGNSVTLNIASNNLNSGFTHSAKITLNGQSATASRTGPGALTVNIPANSTWYGTLPSSTSGTATVTLTTSGNSETGSTSSSITVNIPASIVPSAGSINFSPISQYWNLYLQNISQVKATVSGYSAGSGASISSVSITGNGFSSTSNSLTSGVLRTAGPVSFTATITDTRGRTAKVTNSITVTGYVRPSISSMTLTRCNSSGVSDANGTYVKIGLSYNWSNIGSNTLSADVYVDDSLTASYQALPLNRAYGGSLATLQSYTIRVNLYDSIQTRSSSTVAYIADTLQSVSKILNLYPSKTSGIGIGKIAETEKRVELADGWGVWRNGKSLTPAPRNLLDNSDFSNPVAQAGLNGSHESTKYVCDRWISWDADATFSNGYMTPGSPVDQRPTLDVIDLNKTYTAAIGLADGTVKLDTGTFTNSIGSYNVGIYCPAYTAGRDYVVVRLNTGLNIKWAALYEGEYTAETLPEYVPKGYAAELAECMRYYYQSWTGSIGTAGIITRQSMSPTRLASVEMPVAMWVNPTITIYNSSGTAGAVKDWDDSTVISGITTAYVNNKNFVPANFAYELTTGRWYSFHYSAKCDV